MKGEGWQGEGVTKKHRLQSPAREGPFGNLPPALHLVVDQIHPFSKLFGCLPPSVYVITGPPLHPGRCDHGRPRQPRYGRCLEFRAIAKQGCVLGMVLF
jgi:hypothetical protein